MAAVGPSAPAGGPPITNFAPSLSSSFLPIHVRSTRITSTQADRPQSQAPLELVIGDPHVVRVTAGFDDLTLDRLTDLLEHRW
jgi:hypothetical protein